MRRAEVYFDGTLAGRLVEMDDGKICRFQYEPTYGGPPISLTMPVRDHWCPVINSDMQKENVVCPGHAIP
ncbi:MAG: hypothetical protein C0613_01595 [Desulfobulbaceae bacterium]|nr:MAG: hypothetical protein C0613_01595 [Desulfobulbaceae bacterium]